MRARGKHSAIETLGAALTSLSASRANLTVAQEGAAVARRKAIYEELHPETKRGAAGNAASHGVLTENISVSSFAAATAKATGRTSRTIRTAAFGKSQRTCIAPTYLSLSGRNRSQNGLR
jgi:hypothetical protein